MPQLRNKGYLLPNDPLTENRRYVCVPVPDDTRHIQAFCAQLDMLGYWYTWEKDSAKSAKLAAQAWQPIAEMVRELLQENEGCGMAGLQDVRQNVLLPCTLEKQQNDIWTPFANLKLCAPLFRMNGTIAEISTDGGVTYEPIQAIPPTITPRTGTEIDMRCVASANAANVLKMVYEEIDRLYLSGMTPYLIAAQIITFIALLLTYPIALPTVMAFFSLMIATFNALGSGSYDTLVEEEVKCIFYCASSVTNGIVTFNYAEVLSEIQAKETPLAPIWTILALIVQVVDSNGLNSAGATTQITSASCGCMDCPPDFMLQSWVADTQGTVVTYLGINPATNWMKFKAVGVSRATDGFISLQRVGGGCYSFRNGSFTFSRGVVWNGIYTASGKCSGGGVTGFNMGVAIYSNQFNMNRFTTNGSGAFECTFEAQPV